MDLTFNGLGLKYPATDGMFVPVNPEMGGAVLPGRGARRSLIPPDSPVILSQGRVTGNLDGAPIDDAVQIPDEEMLPIIFDLLKEEGLCLGGSSGINVAGAIRLAKELGPGHTIVTVLADYGTRYQSKLFNPAFLKQKGLPVPAWLDV